jgi:hypothetical protein
LTTRTNDARADLSTPGLVHPRRLLDLFRRVPAVSHGIQRQTYRDSLWCTDHLGSLQTIGDKAEKLVCILLTILAKPLANA